MDYGRPAVNTELSHFNLRKSRPRSLSSPPAAASSSRPCRQQRPCCQSPLILASPPVAHQRRHRQKFGLDQGANQFGHGASSRIESSTGHNGSPSFYSQQELRQQLGMQKDHPFIHNPVGMHVGIFQKLYNLVWVGILFKVLKRHRTRLAQNEGKGSAPQRRKNATGSSISTPTLQTRWKNMMEKYSREVHEAQYVSFVSVGKLIS
ncbi:Uncharacterized protein Fot_35666 [Forsythia ovata]|uniref:Uncharacterized protein n=1 Tax=Forsythia ovata TaxID=205694 RepID=A0ABD1SQ21_9LAMI